LLTSQFTGLTQLHHLVTENDNSEEYIKRLI
jgi:hypothetical protein